MSQKLMEEFPLPVAFSWLKGEHRLLVYWTYNEHFRISLANSDAGILDSFKAILTDGRKDDAEPRKYYAVNIVAPPEAVALRHAMAAQEGEKRSFRDWVGCALAALVKAGEALPAGAKRCTDYAPEQPDAVPDEFDLEVHYGCVNCMSGWLVGTHTLDSYYRLKVRDYRAAIQGDFIKIERPSSAPPCDPTKPLYAVVDDYGSHRDGQVLELVDPETHPGFFPCRQVKFFCHAEELPLPPEAVRLRSELDAKWAQERAERAAQREAESAQVDAEAVAKLKGFFD